MKEFLFGVSISIIMYSLVTAPVTIQTGRVASPAAVLYENYHKPGSITEIEAFDQKGNPVCITLKGIENPNIEYTKCKDLPDLY